MPLLRVMTYNVFGARARRALRTVVESVDPEVMVVNEAPQVPLWWRLACPALASQWQLEHIAGGRNAGRNMVCAAEYVGVRQARVRRIRQPRFFDPIRGVVSAQLKHGGRTFGVVGCHLGLTPHGRARDVQLVLDAADQLEGPVLLAGDLNEDPGGPSWQQLADAGFRDGAAGDALTYPSSQPAKRIDALLVRGDGAEMVDHGVPAVPAALLSRASDHLPVAATLSWG